MYAGFPNIRYFLLVGIASGVPRYGLAGAALEIVLGDVVVSSPRGNHGGVLHSGTVGAVVFSPDGQLIASTSSDSIVRVWETATATGQCRSVLEGHSGTVGAVVFSPDGRTLQTNRGSISLPLGLVAASAVLQTKEPSCTTIESQWILRQNQRFLWLPPEYRNCAMAVYEHIVCLGCNSGCVTLLCL
jgi:WD40 repeat protein